MPLKAYHDLTAFKLYLLDVGLLAAMGDIDVRTLLGGNDIYITSENWLICIIQRGRHVCRSKRIAQSCFKIHYNIVQNT